MKTTSKISAILLAGSLAAGLSANASQIFTESINNINAEVENNPYTGTFTGANLLSGSTIFNNTSYTISSAVVDLTMVNAAGHATTLTIDAFGLILTPTTSPQVLAYTLNSAQDAYIEAMDGTFTFVVEADCKLTSAQLIVTANSNVPPPSPTPDAGSSAILLGGALTALGLLKRKLA
jgi:hypothetical protein